MARRVGPIAMAKTKAKKIKWRDGSAAENASAELPKLARAYFAEVRKKLAANPEPAELHALRLASKRFRYTLELFRPCYAAGLEQRIKALKQLQDLLGDCNDAVASRPRIEAALGTDRAEKARMRKWLAAMAERKAAEFRKHWTEEFDAPGREQWWTSYLERYAR
jgi:CHAD domain-containing protein